MWSTNENNLRFLTFKHGNRIATVIGVEHERGVGRGDGDVVRAPAQGGFRRVRRPVARSASAAGAPCSVEP